MQYPPPSPQTITDTCDTTQACWPHYHHLGSWLSNVWSRLLAEKTPVCTPNHNFPYSRWHLNFQSLGSGYSENSIPYSGIIISLTIRSGKDRLKVTSSCTRSSSFLKAKSSMPQCKGHHWVQELLVTAFDLLCLFTVGQKDKVCCQSWLLDSGWVLQRHPVRDCSSCFACTVGLFLQVRCSWAQSPSPAWDCCRLLTSDDSLPPRLLLLILLVWQVAACEYTFDSKLDHKIHKEHPIWHHFHKEKHADNGHERWRRGAGRVFHDRRFSWRLLYKRVMWRHRATVTQTCFPI